MSKDTEYNKDQAWLTSASPLETTRERLVQVREFVLNRRAHARKAREMTTEPGCPQTAQDALRAEAELADAVASGVESALSILF